MSDSRVRRKLVEAGFAWGRGTGVGRVVERLGRLGLATDGQKTHSVVVGRHLIGSGWSVERVVMEVWNVSVWEDAKLERMT